MEALRTGNASSASRFVFDNSQIYANFTIRKKNSFFTNLQWPVNGLRLYCWGKGCNFKKGKFLLAICCCSFPSIFPPFLLFHRSYSNLILNSDKVCVTAMFFILFVSEITSG